VVTPAVVFGTETCSVRKMDMKRLGTGDREILRRIHGQVEEQGN
jgi:hypothetical protein